MFNYLFGSKPVQKQIDINIKSKPIKLLNPAKLKSNDTVYLICNKTSEAILGVTNSLDKAIQDGNKTTYNNCRILQFKVNTGCDHLNKIVYESL